MTLQGAIDRAGASAYAKYLEKVKGRQSFSQILRARRRSPEARTGSTWYCGFAVPQIADGQDSQSVRTDSVQGIFRIEVAAISVAAEGSFHCRAMHVAVTDG